MAEDQETPASGADDDMMMVPLPVEKSATSELFERALEEVQITEWSQAGARVIKYPVDLGVLLQSTAIGPYHRRCLEFKRLASIGNGYDTARPDAVEAVLPDFNLNAFADDYYTFANAYLERETNAMGRTVRLHHVRANTLWKKAGGGWVQKVVHPVKDKPEWRSIPANKIVHLREYSPFSDHYGVPAWVPALLPVALAWEADEFHRKFYANGAHAGLLIMLTGIKGLSELQRKDVEEKIKSTKGPGNFATLFMAFKDKDVDVKVMGVAKETPVRDDYPEINKVSREKVITAHGLPPRLMSIILDSKAGAMAGQLTEELQLFNLSFVEPTQRLLERFLNPLLPAEIKFKSFLPDAKGQAEPAPDAPGAPESEPAPDDPEPDPEA